METKKFVQFGTVLVIIFLPLFIIFLIMTLTLGLRDNASLIMFSSITLIILIVLLWFYRIVIEINETYISFKLGVGIFGKKYRVESLLSCKPVTNPILYGLGIKKIPNGWIFNVSGLKAIELSFKDKKSIVRIGTNKPQEIAEIINKLIKKQGNAEQYSGETANSKSINTYIIVGSVIVVFVILILIPFYNNRDSKVILNRENMKISDVYGITIKYKDINRIDTLALLPKIEIRTN